MKAIVAIMVGLGLASCVAVGPDGRTAGHYLGYVRVSEPVSDGRGVRVEDVTVVGGWIDGDPDGNGVSAVGLGLRRRELATVSPETCGLTIIVSSDAQLAAVEGLIRNYVEGQACTVRRNSRE